MNIPALRLANKGISSPCGESVRALVANDAKVVREPLPAIAFNGRRVAFLYTRQRELIEFVEAESR